VDGGSGEVGLQIGGGGKFPGQFAGDLASFKWVEQSVVDVPETAVAGVAVQLVRHGVEEGAMLGIGAGSGDEIQGCFFQCIDASGPAPVTGSGGDPGVGFLLAHEEVEATHVGDSAGESERLLLALDLNFERRPRRKALDAAAEFIRGAHPVRGDGDEAIPLQEAGAVGGTVEGYPADGHRVGSCRKGADADGAVAARKVGGQLPIRGGSCCGRRDGEEKEEKGDRCHIAF
jgi:hypothetical protein